MMNHDISLMKRLNSEINGKWFDKGTMDYWGTKIETQPKRNFFITSEDNFNKTERLYSIRFFNPKTYKINTVEINNKNGFQYFKTLEDAKIVLNKILESFNVEDKGNEKINFIFDNLADITCDTKKGIMFIGEDYFNIKSDNIFFEFKEVLK